MLIFFEEQALAALTTAQQRRRRATVRMAFLLPVAVGGGVMKIVDSIQERKQRKELDDIKKALDAVNRKKKKLEDENDKILTLLEETAVEQQALVKIRDRQAQARREIQHLVVQKQVRQLAKDLAQWTYPKTRPSIMAKQCEQVQLRVAL